MRHENPAAWPFFRQDPDRVVLGPRPGAPVSSRPPVRIFLGTEEAQWRAERIFFFSVEKVRDPGRTYEIHLMKNVIGFNRRHWRTGFTNYRYAIPDFAGGSGRAIYNDVDQIYLADPAHLFDLEMGSHGYLAIDPSDTSVMLMDCAVMRPMWNRAAASTGNKYALLSKPKSMPGLWGRLDPHWNARDQEYVEGRTSCLHYTALHQQPWEPFPEHYSYQPNPLAYLWHDLEREADAAGYQVFTAGRPSPGFAARLGRNEPAPAQRRADLPSEAGRRLLAAVPAGDGIVVTLADGASRLEGSAALPTGLATERPRAAADLAQGPAADTLIVDGLLEQLPPADLGWVLDALLARTRRALYVAVDVRGFAGLGSAAWWAERVHRATARHPGLSWHVDAVDPQSALVARGVARGSAAPRTPSIWALVSGRPGDAAVARLARHLGGVVEAKLLHGSTPDRLIAPWPDLVVSGDPGAARIAARVKRESGGRVRVVQLGAPGIDTRAFDLVVALPEDRLPSRPNIVHSAGPLALPPAGKLGHLPQLDTAARPVTTFIVTGGRRPWVMPDAEAGELGRLARSELGSEGTLFVAALGARSLRAARAVVAGAGEETLLVEAQPQDGPALVAHADRLVVTVDDRADLAAASLAGKPVWVASLPRWHDRVPVARPFVKLAQLVTGGGTTYRGTPHQQHGVAQLIDAAIVAGHWHPGPDAEAAHRALVARGLAQRLGASERMASPRPLDDLDRITGRIRALLAEQAG